MKIEIRLNITTDTGTHCDETVLSLDKPHDQLEAIGLSLQEAKNLLQQVQEKMVAAQAQVYSAEQRCCPHCGHHQTSKGYRVNLNKRYQSPIGFCANPQPVRRSTPYPLPIFSPASRPVFWEAPGLRPCVLVMRQTHREEMDRRVILENGGFREDRPDQPHTRKINALESSKTTLEMVFSIGEQIPVCEHTDSTRFKGLGL